MKEQTNMVQSLLDSIEFRHPITHDSQDKDSDTEYQVYFIPGNPGLISYYHSFLAALYSDLSTSFECRKGPNRYVQRFTIIGRSLGGFEVGGIASTRSNGSPFGLHDQIKNVEQAIKDVTGNCASSLRDTENKNMQHINRRVKIILIGHSVGAYILLEVIRRFSEGKSALSNSTRHLSIIGGICLFPTVVDIAKSDHGRKLRWLSKLPDCVATMCDLIVAMTARILTLCLPVSILIYLVGVITQFPLDRARTTAAFLSSARGVRQAIHMGRDEMKLITSDKWDSNVWGSPVTESCSSWKLVNQDKPPKLFFYFGQRDHWVNDQTRDHLISTRGSGGQCGHDWKPKMEIDESGVPHGFCIRHSNIIAEKVSNYVEDIMRVDSINQATGEMTSEEFQNYPMLGF